MRPRGFPAQRNILVRQGIEARHEVQGDTLMTHDPKNYRDPKVTTEHRGSSDAMRWVWIVAALIVVLLFLAWMFGGFGRGTTVTTVPAEQTAPAAQTSAPAATTGDTGTATTGGATTGATGDATAPGTAPATDEPATGATPPAD
jgi:hypothetical protein